MTSSGDDANAPKPRSKSPGSGPATAVQAPHDPITTPSPAPGSIIGCWTPDREPDVPGAKFRPVFVLEVLETFGGLKSLRVAYGTGQNTSAQSRGVLANPWSIEFVPGEGALRILEVTKVDFSKIFVLDY